MFKLNNGFQLIKFQHPVYPSFVQREDPHPRSGCHGFDSQDGRFSEIRRCGVTILNVTRKSYLAVALQIMSSRTKGMGGLRFIASSIGTCVSAWGCTNMGLVFTDVQCNYWWLALQHHWF